MDVDELAQVFSLHLRLAVTQGLEIMHGAAAEDTHKRCQPNSTVLEDGTCAPNFSK